MSGRPNVRHAKERALVEAPGLMPGSRIVGELWVLTRRHARIKLPSGAWVTRPAEQVTLAPPRKETP